MTAVIRKGCKTYTECGIASSVSRFGPESDSWTPVGIIICDNSENARRDKVFNLTERESSTSSERVGHLQVEMRISAKKLPRSIARLRCRPPCFPSAASQ
jgi:hypothetical protein